MMRDIVTIVRKELIEWLGGAGKRSRITLAIFTLVFGVVMPLQSGVDWVTSPGSVAVLAWLPFILVTSTVADTVAGERERHTLETLLASRLSDGALFFGKLIASVLYAVAQVWAIGLVSIATINIAHWSGHLLFYSGGMTVTFVVGPLLVAGLAGGVGMLVSIRAESARAAYQSLTVAIFVLAVPLFLVGFLPDSVKSWLQARLSGIDVATAAIVVGIALAAADTILITIARSRFRRGKLAL